MAAESFGLAEKEGVGQLTMTIQLPGTESWCLGQSLSESSSCAAAAVVVVVVVAVVVVVVIVVIAVGGGGDG